MEKQEGAAVPLLELPGFRFHPTEKELLEFYLKQHVSNSNKKQQYLKAAPFDIIPTVHLYRHDPWDLPGLAAIDSEHEWYFFVPRDNGSARKHAAGIGGGGRAAPRSVCAAMSEPRGRGRAEQRASGAAAAEPCSGRAAPGRPSGMGRLYERF